MPPPVIPYLPQDLAEPIDVVAAVRARRGGALLNLDRMLLHSPALARGWNAFLGEVRRNLSISPKLREIAICGVAVINRAEYEFVHHAPELLAAGGTTGQVEAMRGIAGMSPDLSVFSAVERDVIRLTLAMTRDIEVTDELLSRLQGALGNTATVELVGVIATYNMVSRFLIALGITPEDDHGPSGSTSPRQTR